MGAAREWRSKIGQLRESSVRTPEAVGTQICNQSRCGKNRVTKGPLEAGTKGAACYLRNEQAEASERNRMALPLRGLTKKIARLRGSDRARRPPSQLLNDLCQVSPHLTVHNYLARATAAEAETE